MRPLALQIPLPSALRTDRRAAIRAADHATSVLCVVALALLAVLLTALVAGYRPLIDHSGSMRPAIEAGDVLITRSETAGSVRRGDIVAFLDPNLGGKLVTHRVVGVRDSAGLINFATRGDANPAPERWSAARDARLGVVVLRIPAIGEALAWTEAPWARTILLALVTLLLSTALLRRIWRR